VETSRPIGSRRGITDSVRVLSRPLIDPQELLTRGCTVAWGVVHGPRRLGRIDPKCSLAQGLTEEKNSVFVALDGPEYTLGVVIGNRVAVPDHRSNRPVALHGLHIRLAGIVIF